MGRGGCVVNYTFIYKLDNLDYQSVQVLIKLTINAIFCSIYVVCSLQPLTRFLL